MFNEEYKILMNGWEAKQNERGVIYYANKELQITSWNHPYLKTILDSLDDIHGEIKYAAYRTSLKLRALQCQTGIQWVNFTAMKMVFASSLQEYEECASHNEALAIIQRILETSDNQHQHEVDIPIAAELILSLMMILYDVNREGKLMVRSMRNAFTALSTAKLSDKYKYFFLSLKGANQRIHQRKLEDLIDDLIQITEVLKESTAFGNSVTAAAESCFMQANSPQHGSVSEENFYAWLLQEPQTLVWLPTLHRVLATEEVEHDVRCSVCRRTPIIGFRYRCLQCFKYDLCQNCFLHGQTSLTHKLKHHVKEYCLPTSTRDNTKALFQIIKNKFSRKSRNQAKIKYLPVGTGEDVVAAIDVQFQGRQPNQGACNSNSTDSGLTTGSDTVDTGSQSEEDDSGARIRNRPIEILGQPCDTSSPVVGGSGQINFLSKQDMGGQQKHMAWKIEQLQKENRALQQKLMTLQRHYDVDLSDHHSDAEGSKINHLSEDPLKEITMTSPISPIATDEDDGKEMMNAGTGDNSKGHPNILDIVGTYTPVRSVPCTLSSSILNYEDEKLNENPDSSKPVEFKATNYDLTKSTMPNDLQYRSSDMSLDSSREQEVNQTEKKITQMDEPSANNSTSSNGLVYKSSDMSLDFLDTMQMSQNPEINNKQLCEYTRDVQLVDYSDQSLHQASKSEKISSTTTNSLMASALCASHQPHLIFSSNSLKQKEETSCNSTFLSAQGNTLHENSKGSSENDDQEETGNKWANPFTTGTGIMVEDGACVSVELSEIFPHNSPSSFKFLQTWCDAGLTPTQVKTNSRRKTLEPVHMSTPVYKQQHLHPKSAYLIRQQPRRLLDSSGTGQDKENITALPVLERGWESPEQTSQAAGLSLHRKGILLPAESVLNIDSSKGEIISDDFSDILKGSEGTGNLTNEDHTKLSREDKDQFEKLEFQMEKLCASLDSDPETEEQGEELSDYLGVLAEVQNIGGPIGDYC